MAGILDIREKTKIRRFVYAKPTILVLAILVGVIIHGVFGIYQKEREAVAKREKANEELASIMAREAELKENIERLSTERGIEAEIRDRFMVAKEGEKVMIIATPDANVVHSVTVTEEPESLFQKMMSAVGVSQ